MKDTVGDAVQEAVVPDAPSLFFPPGVLKRFRVPGQVVSENKADGGDRPCILVEFDDGEGNVTDRFLVHEVTYHGKTWFGQSFTDPCPVNGAVIWLETEGAVTLHTRGDA